MADLTKDQVVDYLSNLPVIQIAELIKTLEDKWGESERRKRKRLRDTKFDFQQQLGCAKQTRAGTAEVGGQRRHRKVQVNQIAKANWGVQATRNSWGKQKPRGAVRVSVAASDSSCRVGRADRLVMDRAHDALQKFVR
jgi:hypothetical protein